MADLDQMITDAIADGSMTTGDANEIHAFAEFLRQTPEAAVRTALTHRERVGPRCFPTRKEFETWRTRWLPYLVGLADGPCTPEEYAEHLPALKEFNRAHGKSGDPA